MSGVLLIDTTTRDQGNVAGRGAKRANVTVRADKEQGKSLTKSDSGLPAR